VTLLSPRQGLTTVQERFQSPRQGLTTITEFVSPRQGLTTIRGNLLSPRQGRTSIWSEDFAATVSSPAYSEWVANLRNLVKVPRPSLSYAGEDLSGLLGDVSFSFPLNGKATCSFELNNPATNGVVVFPSPLVPPGSGDYADIIRQHSGTQERLLQFSLTFAGQPWVSDPFLPSAPSHDGTRLKWGGEDLTPLLEEVPDDPLDDIILDGGDLWMAHAAARQTAEAAGIQIELRYPDYLIGEHRRGTGNYLQHLDALAKPMCAARRWENGVLVYEQIQTSGPPMWRFVERLNIRKWEVAELPRAQNVFTLARFSPAGGQIGQARGRETKRNSITFEPSRSVHIDIIACVQGRLDDWVFFDAAGNNIYTGGASGDYSGVTMAVRADFTYYPNIGATAYEPYYEVVARGGQRPRDTSYRTEVSDAAHQSVYGVVKGSAINEPTLGDQAGADTCAAAYLAESVRKVYQGKLETPYLNPFIRPGHLVEVTDHWTAQSGSVWVVESVSFGWTGANCSMTLEMTKGL